MSLEVNITKKLNNFTLHAVLNSDGNSTGILGESGCGKSMLLKCIAGIETPDSGSIVLDGRILFDSEKKINLPPQKRGVGYLFQNYALFPSMTVAQNIASGIYHGKRFLSRQEKEEVHAIVKEQINRCRLQGLENSYPGHLSGGQQQRAALARMLAVNPSMIMLDEPFSALDSHLKDAMQKEMHEIISNYPGNILIVSHSRDELYRLCDSLYVMSLGNFIRTGAIREVFQNPENVKAAILTGCKNIASVRKRADGQLEVPEWGLTLSPSTPATDSTSHVGIRAHYFHVLSRISEQNPFEEKPNHFKAQIFQVEEQPFEYNYYLKTGTGSTPFIWKIHKTPEFTFLQGEWLSFSISPKDIMLLSE